MAAMLAAVATPAFAWQVQQLPGGATPSARFADPDEALESAGSSLRDSVVESSLASQGVGAFTGLRGAYGASGQNPGFGLGYGAGRVGAVGASAYGSSAGPVIAAWPHP